MRVKLSQLLRAMSQACDLVEGKDLGHGQRLTVLALAFARASGSFEMGEKAELAVSAMMHDLGLASVIHQVHQLTGLRSRELMARYPAVSDGLFGLGPTEGAAELRALLARHADHGARTLQALGYGDVVAGTVASHHLDASCETWSLASQVVALADLLETGTYPLDTAEARRAHGVDLLQDIEQSRFDPELMEAVRPLLETTELWEEVFFFDDLGAELDLIFETTYGQWIEFEGLEAHLRVLAQAVDAQTPFASGHTFEVSRLSRRIGERIGLEPEDLNRLHLASLLHGVGRLGLPIQLLEKGGGLTEDEFCLLHTYPNITRDALAPLADLRDLVEEASTHREKLDGSGYPEARSGDGIPIIGRILSAADTFMALISDRPYRPAYARSRALAIVQAESARLFDGLVTDALESVYREGL
ncbi:MAG: hypothetical protein CO108_20535 [Deltaproteobacteria bacterium CG_4_9_14_3_um_filter_63_12]|nr:MAG: hypothetical protein CO108_20535 [Deltaproteobacteria bacterium CG_4_9_14_3_um_filter_63_12]